MFGPKSGPEWNTLSVTWGANPLNRNYFLKQPLTADEARNEGFEQISNECQGILNS